MSTPTTPANPPTLIPLYDGFTYLPHQTVGIQWMQKRELSKPCGGIVCDEMGLGKTIEALGLLKSDGKQTNTLLLAPVAVLSQWEEKARESKITVLKHARSNKTLYWKIEGKFNINAPRLHIIGYEMARNKPSLVLSMAWDRIICDEAHRVSPKSALSKLVERIHSPSKWFLTGTPIVNSLADLTNLLELMGVKDVKHISRDFDLLQPVINTYVLARSMDDLRSTMPNAPPVPEVKTLALPFITSEEGEFYNGMTGTIVKKWKALDADVGGGKGLMKLQLFMRLRQLSVHPQVYIEGRRKALGPLGYTREDWAGSSTKFETIKGLLQSSEEPHKWIIFCHFHSEMNLLKKELEAEEYVRKVYIYNGTLSHPERATVLEATKAPLVDQHDILLIQLQSGGVGINLQHFDRIIFSGPWWTSALMNQAIARAVRIGQKKVVEVYHLKLEDESALNIDAIMMEKANSKGELCKQVLEMATRDLVPGEKPKKFQLSRKAPEKQETPKSKEE